MRLHLSVETWYVVIFVGICTLLILASIEDSRDDLVYELRYALARPVPRTRDSAE